MLPFSRVAVAVFLSLVFDASTSAQVLPGITPTYGAIRNTKEGEYLSLHDPQIEVIQIADDNNARVEIQNGKMTNGHFVGSGPAIEVWLIGPTANLIDGQKVYKFPPLVKNGVKRYASAGGPRSLTCFKVITEAIKEEWRKNNPDHVSLTTKKGVTVDVVIQGYKSGLFDIQSLGNRTKIKSSLLDSKSKAKLSEWRRKQKGGQAEKAKVAEDGEAEQRLLKLFRQLPEADKRQLIEKLEAAPIPDK